MTVTTKNSRMTFWPPFDLAASGATRRYWELVNSPYSLGIRRLSFVNGCGPRNVYTIALLGGFGAMRSDPQWRQFVTGGAMNLLKFTLPLPFSRNNALSNSLSFTNKDQLELNSSRKVTTSSIISGVSPLLGQRKSTIL